MQTGNPFLDGFYSLFEAIELHLAGQHDQSTHGSWAGEGDESGDADFETLRETLRNQKEGTVDISAFSDFDIERNLMPQLRGVPAPGSRGASQEYKGHRKKNGEINVSELFVEDLSKYGIRSMKAQVSPKNLKPTQGEVDAAKVQDERWDEPEKHFNPRSYVLVSKDNYIIDGHHRWAGAVVRNPDARIPVLKVDMTAEELLPYTRAFTERWGIQTKGIYASADDILNGTCTIGFHLLGQHDQQSHGSWATGSEDSPEYAYPTGDDMSDNFEAVEEVERHYGRKEMAPEMGGVQWAFEGGSPPITEAAQDVLQGYDYDPYDRFLAYDRSSHAAAVSILKTIEDARSDVTLYSGHKRGRDYVNDLLADGNVSFPLVATSPDKDLADIYAGSKENTGDTVAVVYHFPPGSQAGFYQFNEHIATGEYKVTRHEWYDDNVVDIYLEQTKRSQVPELTLPGEEEEE